MDSEIQGLIARLHIETISAAQRLIISLTFVSVHIQAILRNQEAWRFRLVVIIGENYVSQRFVSQQTRFRNTMDNGR